VKAMAPGKLLLTGAYAVLEGAPAVVVAVDRYAVADASQMGRDASAEVRAALGDEPAPAVDTRPLQDETGRKLGLGSSAAALVASLGVRALARGEDLRASGVRARIFRVARESHARAQGGGSGVDVAASVHGGVLRYTVDGSGGAAVRALELPRDLSMVAYDSGTSVRTCDMRARFDWLRARPADRRLLAGLFEAAQEACAAVEAGDTRSFVTWAREFGSALGVLGRLADAPIVPPRFAELASLAERERAAFFPSGAGGGDVAVWLGTAPPSAAFASRAEALSMRLLALGIDRGGLRPDSTWMTTSPRLAGGSGK
jgi:phosphomevalonate kinase